MWIPETLLPNETNTGIALNEGDLLGDRWTILSRKGEGGMSVVYRAHDAKLNETVVLKVFRKEKLGSVLLQRIQREVRVVARRRPNRLNLGNLR